MYKSPKYILDDGIIREKELANFYVRFIGISKDSVESLAKYAMEQMTDVSFLCDHKDDNSDNILDIQLHVLKPIRIQV